MFGAHFQDYGYTESPWAFNCGLSFCKQTIETMTISGATTQNIIRTTFNDTLTSSMGLEPFYSYSSPVNIAFDETAPHPISTDTHVLYAWSTFLPATWIGSVSYQLQFGTVYTAVNDSGPFLRAIAGAAKPGGYAFQNPDWENQTETGEDIPALFARIATSMTTSLRTEVGIVSVPGQGKIMTRQVDIRWEWLVLPGAVVLLTWIFLFGVVIVNSRSKATKWKSNALAILAVGSSVGQKLSGVQDAETLIKTAKEIKVNMIRDHIEGGSEYLSVHS